MQLSNLQSCIRLLRLLREPHTVRCLARQAGCCTKSVRRDIARLRRAGFLIIDERAYEWGPKKYRAVDPLRDFSAMLRKRPWG
jgi:predicted DNA-binding transcriptional regulator YafY